MGISKGRRKRVLIIVQNLPVPLDRRVWLEAMTLRDRGYDVAVICPKGPGDPDVATIDGIRVFKYDPPPETHGALSYAREFAQAWFATARRSLLVWREGRFDVLQACNPPDTYWALARLWKLRGVKFVYDQHDLNPELFFSRFGMPRSVVGRLEYGLLKWLERRTYRTADHVISTNESYRRIALRRGSLNPSKVTVVRSGPDTAAMRPAVDRRDDLKRGRRYLLVYLGIMGPQDGVDLLLDAMHELVRMGRRDVHLALLGFGDCYQELRAQASRQGLNGYVTFTGRADRRLIAEYLSAADVGVCPDPLSPLNDVSTMNKTMEYMAYALPVVSFDLKETRVSAGEAAVYVPPGDVAAFAQAISDLLDDAERRAKLSLLGRERVVRDLDWQTQRDSYVAVFDRLLGITRRSTAERGWPLRDRRRANQALVDTWGHRLVDLRRVEELEDFVRNRPSPLVLD